MAISEYYMEYLKELLEWLPALRAKKMFGGAGFYSDELFFAIADDNGLYLKADGESEPFYRSGGSEQFTYESKGKTGRMIQGVTLWIIEAVTIVGDVGLQIVSALFPVAQ